MASHGSKTVIYAALSGNAFIALTKFGAAWLTGSSAMLSEAIHSLVDTGNQILLLHGMRQAAKPATRDHPFGHGLELYFWTFIVAILVFGLGGGIAVWEGIAQIMHPHPIENLRVSFGVLLLGVVFEGVTWLIALKSFSRSKGKRPWMDEIRASKDPTVFTVLFEDTAALLGLVIAAAGLAVGDYFQMPVMDGVASVSVGILLASTASFLAFESKSLLTGEGVHPEVRSSIRALSEAEVGVTRINELLTMHFGPRDVLVALSLDFEDSQTAGAVERTVSRLERRIKAEHPDVTRVFIECQSFDASRRAAEDAAALALVTAGIVDEPAEVAGWPATA